MSGQSTTSGTTMDRRVRRSRTALMGAVVALVSERGTANVPVSDIAKAADVSRQLLYQQFGDRDTLLLEAALDLARRDLVPLAADASNRMSQRDRILAGARHFARYRSFYRAGLTGPCGYALNKALTDLLVPFNQRSAHRLAGPDLAPDLAQDLALFITGGASTVFNTWLVEGTDPLDPEAFTDRLMRMLSALTDPAGEPHPDLENR